MTALTMIDKQTPPSVTQALKILRSASTTAKTPAPGAWAFYIGGAEYLGGKPTPFTNAFLDGLASAGVQLLPIYVGLQHKRTHAQGVSDATDAIALAHQLGDRNTIIATDIENGTASPGDDLEAALRYVNGWTETLHAASLRSMVYGSRDLAAELAKRGDPQPDAYWVAAWETHAPQPGRDPHRIRKLADDVFDQPGQRAQQYAAKFADKGATELTECIVAGVGVDVSIIDAEVFSTVRGGPPPKHHPKKGPVTVPKGTPSAHHHVIQSGDTLSALERTFSLPHGSLFKANRQVLDAAAKTHGHKDSNHGGLIFPGVTITIP